METHGSETAGMMPPMNDKNRRTLSDYISDLVALETHIEEALERQQKEVKDDPIATAAVHDFHSMVRAQRERMKSLQDDYGATVGSPIKEVGSSIFGKAAGMIDRIRTEGISKALRDDYTAFNLAAISYSMLHTTAIALGDQRVADIAERHLGSYADAITRANAIVGDIVVAELAKDGHKVQPDASARTRKLLEKVWRTHPNS